MHKRTFHILLFAFGVFMLLARPFMVYQMCAAGDFNKDPQRVYNLLQRLIKKKDDHHADESDQVAVVEAQKPGRLLPARLVVILVHLFSLSSFRHLFPKRYFSRAFVTARPHSMICRFQI